MMATAVLAPGEAPSSAAMEPSAAVTISVPNSSTPPCFLVFLDDLHALAGHGQLPVGGVGGGVVLAQGSGAVFRRLQHLADEVAGEAQVAGPGVEQRPDVAQLNGAEQIGVRALLQKLGAEARVGAEQQLLAGR